MKKRFKKWNRGMSLLEVMIVSGLAAIFSIFLVSLVMTSQNAWLVQNTGVPVRADARQTMDAMVKELREADLNAPGGILITGSGGMNGQIYFSVPDQVAQNSILSWRMISFNHWISSQTVTRHENGVNTGTIGRNIQFLNFTLSNNVITTTITAVRTIPGETSTLKATWTSQVKVRN